VEAGRLVQDHFASGPSPYWVRYLLGYGEIERGQSCLRLALGPSPADLISDSQIHDYRGGAKGFSWHPPLQMRVRARFSHPPSEFSGTAGFGFWNDPFTTMGEVVAAPNNAWFFYASPPSAMELVAGVPGWGWKAAVLDGGRLPGWAMKWVRWLLRFPVWTRLLGRVARRRARAAEALLPHDPTAWHDYELRWSKQDCTFRVDGTEVLKTPFSPTPPLGFVAWVDNQYAVARPDGTIAFGRLAVPRQQWLELGSVEIMLLAVED
jgi:hypothetical protein